MAIYDRSFGGYRLFCGDLGSRVGKYELEREFEYYGPLLDVWVARNPPGFAFLVFKFAEDAERATRELNGRMCCGRRIRVEHARPYEPRRSRGPPQRGGRGGGGPPRRQSYRRSKSRERKRSRSRSRDRRRSRSRSRSPVRGRKSRSRSRDRSRKRSNSIRDDRKKKSRSLSRSRSRSRGGSRSPSPNMANHKVVDAVGGSPTNEETRNGDAVQQEES